MNQNLKAATPLFVVNALTVYAQGAYAYTSVAPQTWSPVFRVILAIGFAIATESVSLYVQWHAHDALLLKSHATARQLRRASYVIAAAVATMNYSHFAADGMRPTAAAVAFGMLSLLSPWMWGLHTRRAARVQLLKERRADEGGAEFSSERRRAFPVLTWKARRWSIMHNVTDPVQAWTAFIAERNGTPAAPKAPKAPTMDIAPVSGGPAVRWDLDKVVAMVVRGEDKDAIMSATNVSVKNYQRTRRVIKAIQANAPDMSIVKSDVTAKFVKAVRRAMEDKA